jgi:hypothetical protein
VIKNLCQFYGGLTEDDFDAAAFADARNACSDGRLRFAFSWAGAEKLTLARGSSSSSSFTSTASLTVLLSATSAFSPMTSRPLGPGTRPIAPTLVVEALSPWSADRDVGPKFAAYEEHGVQEYWVLDPEHLANRFYRREGELLVELPTSKERSRRTSVQAVVYDFHEEAALPTAAVRRSGRSQRHLVIGSAARTAARHSGTSMRHSHGPGACASRLRP